MLEIWPRSLRLHKPLIKWANVFSNQAEKWKWEEDSVSNLQRFLPAIVSFFFLFVPNLSIATFALRKCWRFWSQSTTWWGGTPTRVCEMRLPTSTWTSSFRLEMHGDKMKSKTFLWRVVLGFVCVCVYFPLENGQKPGWCRDHWRVHWDLPEGLCFYNLVLYRFTDFIHLLYAL